MKSQELVEKLMKNLDLEIGVVNISYYFTTDDEVEKKKIISEFVKMFGKFDIKIYPDLGDVDLVHESNGLRIVLNRARVCKIVGKIMQKRAVEKPVVPTQMITVMEDVAIPVTDCQIKSGLVDADSVIYDDFAQPETKVLSMSNNQIPF